MKFISPAIVLTLICAVAALALAAVNTVTKPVIAEQERLFRLRSIKKAIPSYDNNPDQDVVNIGNNGSNVCIFRGRKNNQVTGVSFEWTQEGGYSGAIKVLLGLNPDGTFACNGEQSNSSWVGLQILQHAETPGLGALMEGESWRRQFCNSALDDHETSWSVKKDGGQIDQLTGATITSRVVIEAIKGARNFYHENREAILNAEGGSCNE